MKNSDYENQSTYQNALVIYCTLSSFTSSSCRDDKGKKEHRRICSLSKHIKSLLASGWHLPSTAYILRRKLN